MANEIMPLAENLARFSMSSLTEQQPPVLTAMLQSSTMTKFGDHGYEPVEIPWVAPTVVTPDLHDAAIVQAREIDRVMGRSTHDQRAAWITSLIALVPGRIEATEAEIRISAYANFLSEFPAVCFGAEALRMAASLAARRLMGLPGAGEIAEMFDGYVAAIRERRSRLGQIIAAPQFDRQIKHLQRP